MNNKLDKFSTEYCDLLKVQVGDEYKVVEIERDPFYGQMPEEYRKKLLLENQRINEFSKNIYDFQRQITDYFAGEYTETTDDEFQEIWKDFFYHWYWDDVYVCYSPELLNIQIESWKERLDINKYKSHWRCPYRLLKLVKREEQNKGIYSCIWTGIHYEIDETQIPMVWASANDGMNWRYWRDLIKEFIAAEQYFIKTQKLSGKRIIRDIKNTDNVTQENENLAHTSVIFDINATDATMKNRYVPFDACHPEIPKGIWDNAINWFRTRAGLLGYIQNMNDKKERLTTGENFKDLHGATNIQINNLKQLNNFGREFSLEYPGKELNFNLSNWGEAEGIPIGELEGEELDNIPNNEDERE